MFRKVQLKKTERKNPDDLQASVVISLHHGTRVSGELCMTTTQEPGVKEREFTFPGVSTLNNYARAAIPGLGPVYWVL
jgi:hypothetical protein